jgi:CRISPR/Cas system CSM-associated protein Csm3 (group 7 of RAMP superfamily)
VAGVIRKKTNVNENDYQKINFRIILDSEAILDLDSDGQPAMLASSVMGQIRWACRHLLGSESAEEEAIFGSLGQAAKILALPMTFHGSPDVRLNVALDPFTGSAKDAALFEEFIVPAGATIIGAIIVSRSLALRYRTLIQSAILNIEQSGIGKRARSGFGRCHVEFVDLIEGLLWLCRQDPLPRP